MIGIEIEHLSRRFATVEALSDLSISFAPGMLHGLIGPDGAGKTTLLRILAGLLRADSGQITYLSGGKAAPFETLRPMLSYMPSRPSLYPDLSIHEHLEFFRELYQLPRDLYQSRRAELLSVTQLEKFTERGVGMLSGGMYKKTALMCALLQSPAFLLLDEPTNGVDPISRREFWELLRGMAEKKILVIVSTAYMDEAERCQRVHLIDSGTLLNSGEPQNMLAAENVKGFNELFLKMAKA